MSVRKRNNKSSNEKTNDFITKSRNIFGDEYEYSKVIYENAKTKVTITCRIHGDFYMTPNGHLSKKAGCRYCATQRNADKAILKCKKEFVEKARNIHSDKYYYTKVDYKNAKENVIIICPIHGDFEQTPNNHLRGAGCRICSGKFVTNTETFIIQANIVHCNKYEYTKTNYEKSNKNVTITCITHGDFEQTPNIHLCGSGCFKCGHNMTIFSTEEFIHCAQKVHGNKYDYGKSIYINMSTKVLITCNVCTETFEQTPSNHITHKQGCLNCAGTYLSNTKEFIEKATIVHCNKYEYPKTDYINNHTNVIIKCPIHGDFNQTPQSHLSGSGCRDCGNENRSLKQRKDENQFIQEAQQKHDGFYTYENVNYIGAHFYVDITCPKHGNFPQTPTSHLSGSGCRDCVNKTETKMKEYLEKEKETLHIKSIKHHYRPKWTKVHGTFYEYDFYIELTNGVKIIIEVDGPQHYEQVRNWGTPIHNQIRDHIKERLAGQQEINLIRLNQEHIWEDKENWRQELHEFIQRKYVNNDIIEIYHTYN